MSTSTVTFEELSSEQQYFLNTTPQDLEPIFDSQRAPVAQALHARGLTKKALRHDDCARVITSHHCVKGHITHLVSHCGLSICIPCALDDAKVRTEEVSYQARILATKAPHLRMTFVEVRLPCAPDREATQAAYDYFIHTYLSLLPGASASYGSKHEVDGLSQWSFAAGLVEGDLILRLLAVDTTCPEHAVIKAAFSSSSRVVVSTCSVTEAPKFAKFLFALAIPKDAEGAADMELAFTRVRRYRSLGEEPAKAEISVTEASDTTLNSAPEEGTGHKKCSICHAAIIKTEVTRLSDQLRPPHYH